MKTDITTLYHSSEGGPYLSVRVYDSSDLDLFGKRFEEFYDTNEEDNKGAKFGGFGYDLFYRLGCCIHKGSFSIRKPNTNAKLQKTNTYNLIEPIESVEGPIQSITEDQLCGYVVHKTVSTDTPHLRCFTVYGTDEKELKEISANYSWFIHFLEEEIFGSSDTYWHWLRFSEKDPKQRRKYVDHFIEDYFRKLRGEEVEDPMAIDGFIEMSEEDNGFLKKLEGC